MVSYIPELLAVQSVWFQAFLGTMYILCVLLTRTGLYFSLFCISC